MLRRVRSLLLLALVAAAAVGCADINPPPAGVQAARFGVLITWDTTKSSNTTSAENALIAKCSLPASSHYGPGGPVASGESSTYVSVPSGTLRDTTTSCLTQSSLVSNVDILSGPAPN